MARLVQRAVVDVCGEMSWPAVTEAVSELSWKCRFFQGSLSQEDYLVLASIVDAYVQMVKDPQEKRNAVCAEIAEASEE